jgi:uncharacterized protein (DUF302 family)
MSTATESGVLNLASPCSVEETTHRLVNVIGDAGMTVFAQIDQKDAAQAAGVTTRPMVLVLFGDPKVGTPLMQAHPTLAIDLPLKAVVWKDATGQVWVTTNSPQYLQKRHGMAEAPFAAVPGLLERALESRRA